MKSVFSLRSSLPLTILCGIILTAGVFAFRAQGGLWDKRTVITTDQIIQVQDVVLQPGTYVLMLSDVGMGANRHIVQIFNKDENRIMGSVLAIPNSRLEPTGDSRFLFYETPPGTAKALHAWFYPGDNFGQEFLYPKQLTQLAGYSPAPAPLPPEPAPTEQAQAPAQEPTQPQAEVQQEQRSVVTAQNNTPTPEPQTEASPAPEALPKTASPYPLIGLSGLLSLGLYGLLRVKRLA